MLTSFLTFFRRHFPYIHRTFIDNQALTYYLFLYRLQQVTPFFKGGVPRNSLIINAFRAGYTFF